MEEEKLESSVNSVSEKELRDLERLAEKFSKKSNSEDMRGDFNIDIQGNSVYGYNNHKRKHLGSYSEYSRYKNLKLKYKNKVKKDETQKKNETQKSKDDEVNEIDPIAYKCFLEHNRSAKYHNS